jgi:hypothetical protein
MAKMAGNLTELMETVSPQNYHTVINTLQTAGLQNFDYEQCQFNFQHS